MVTRPAKYERILTQVAIAANEAPTVDYVMRACVDRICEILKWPVGHVYLRSQDESKELSPSRIWHLDDPRKFERFQEVTEVTSLARGVGLPGRVLDSGKPAWIVDVTKDPNFPRAQLAEDIGVKAGFAFPVTVQNDIVAILEFFSDQAGEPDVSLLEVVAQIGRQLGQVIERKRAEREHELRFRSLVEGSLQGIAIIRPNSEIVFANSACAEMYGYSSVSEFIGTAVDKLTAPHELPRQLQYREARLRGAEAPDHYETEGVKKDGSPIWIDLLAKQIEWEGEPAILLTAIDISERKQAQQELEDSQLLLHSVFDALPLWVAVKDVDGRIVKVNRQMAEECGVAADRFIGLATLELPHSTEQNKVHLAQLEQKVLETGQRVEDPDVSVELPGGELRAFHAIKIPLRDAQGQIVGTVTVSNDITERKRAEEALRESEARFRAIAKSTPNAVVITTVDEGRVVYANDRFAELFRLEDDPTNHTSVEWYANPDDRGVLVSKLKEHGRITPTEWHCIRSDGEEFWALLSSVEISYAGMDCGLSNIVDISKSKEAEAALVEAKERAEKATRLKDNFVALIAHDLRSPIGAVLGMLHFLDPGKRAVDEAKQRDFYRQSIGRLNGMVTLIDEMLDVSRFQTGKIELKMEPHLAFGLTLPAMALKPSALDKGVELINEVPEDLEIVVDATYIGQVIQNLVSNAIKFSNAGDTVTIFVPADRPNTIAVRDTGLGIPTSMQPDLFRHDVKTTTTGTNDERGTGLGLPLSHDIVQAHGGQLEMESREGEGSVFYVELPDSQIE